MSADYTVFIDESFYRWFGQLGNDASLCYGALAIPTDRLANLDRFEASVRPFATAQLPAVELAKPRAPEFKYSDFRHLPAEAIDSLGQKLGYFLQKNHAFIFGFFIPAEGFLHYKLRDELHDAAAELNALTTTERSAKIASLRKQMLAEWEAGKLEGKRDLALIERFYHPFFNFVLQFHARTLKKTFQVVYDSRNAEEDLKLHQGAEEMAKIADRLNAGVSSYYRGYTTGSSASTTGLRLADWIAGEVRAFFYRNPAVIEAGSKFEILSASPNPEMTIVDRAPYYKEMIPESAYRYFVEKGQKLMLPHIKDHFAGSLISYYAKHGEARHLSVYEKTIYNLAD